MWQRALGALGAVFLWDEGRFFVTGSSLGRFSPGGGSWGRRMSSQRFQTLIRP